MKNQPFPKIISVVLGGFCFAVMCLLLALAYIPDLSPTAYSNFRRSGLIMAVPMIAGVGIIASVGWLWFEHRMEENAKNGEDN